MHKTLLLFCALLASLAGCISSEERARREQQHEISECLNLGLVPDTQDFSDCRMQIRAANAAMAMRGGKADDNIEPSNLEVDIHIDDNDDTDDNSEDDRDGPTESAAPENAPAAPSETSN